jgi:hypothetical protein
VKKLSSVLVSLALLFPSTGFAQDTSVPSAPVRVERRSRNMAIIGAALATVGAVGLIGTIETEPEWGETYTLYGDQVCVQSSDHYFDVKDGGCSHGGALWGTQVIPYMTAALFGGSAMVILGLQKVEVRPVVGRGVTGASATIRWGGRQSSSRK